MENQKHLAKVIIDLSYQLKRDLDKAAAAFGLTRTQAVILRHVEIESAKQDIFQKDIEKEFRIRKSSVTSVIQLLEKNGYIKRESVSEDARLKKIVLTDKALEINNKIGNSMENREEKFYKVLTKKEINSFFSIINKISNTLDE